MASDMQGPHNVDGDAKDNGRQRRTPDQPDERNNAGRGKPERTGNTRPGAREERRSRPFTVYQRMNHERMLLLGGGAALLLQLADPAVAAGVDQHSDFAKRPIRRLLNTIRAMHTLVFADDTEQQQVSERLRAMHTKVVGQMDDGIAYHALQPELQLWVHATLVQVTLDTYSTFVQDVPPHTRDQFYAGSLRTAAVLNIPASVVPPDWPSFTRYYQQRIKTLANAVTPTARRLSLTVLYPPVIGFPPSLAGFLRVMTTGLLPPPMRKAYVLRWDGPTERRYFAWRRRSRRWLSEIPTWLRHFPD